MSFKNILFFVSAFCFSTHSFAGAFVQGGLHFGGDTLATVSIFGSGNESIEAGGLLSGSVGYEADINESLLAKLSAGIKFDSITASNGDVDFTRYPLTAMLFIKGEDLHFGVGLTKHTGVELSVDGFSGAATADFDNATGFVAQLDYLLNERGYISLKFTFIDYELANSNLEVDGGSIGILAGFRFGK